MTSVKSIKFKQRKKRRHSRFKNNRKKNKINGRKENPRKRLGTSLGVDTRMHHPHRTFWLVLRLRRVPTCSHPRDWPDQVPPGVHIVDVWEREPYVLKRYLNKRFDKGSVNKRLFLTGEGYSLFRTPLKRGETETMTGHFWFSFLPGCLFT